LQVFDADEAADINRAGTAIADGANRFTPLVALDSRMACSRHHGCAHLFGGEGRI